MTVNNFSKGREREDTVQIQRTAAEWEIMASRKEELSLDGAEGFGVLDREKGCCEEVVGTWWIKEGRGELKKKNNFNL